MTITHAGRRNKNKKIENFNKNKNFRAFYSMFKRILWSLSWLYKPANLSWSIAGNEFWYVMIVVWCKTWHCHWYIIFSKPYLIWHAEKSTKYWYLHFSCFTAFEYTITSFHHFLSFDISILLFEKSHAGGPVHLKMNLVSPKSFF